MAVSQTGGKSSAFQCPHCGGKFALPAEFQAQRVRCPHCKQAIALPPAAEGLPAPLERPTLPEPLPPPPSPTTPPNLITPKPPAARLSAAPANVPGAGAVSATDVGSAGGDADVEQAARLERARQLLPPKFTARAQNLPAAAGSEVAVLIPTAEGGFSPVAADLVRITHRGREVTLRRSRPTLLRTWFSAIVVLVCAVLLVAAFFWLLRSNSN